MKKAITNKFWVVLVVMVFSSIIDCCLCNAAVEEDGDIIFGYIHEIGLILVGLFMFFYGFTQYRKKRLIENIPTSKIRAVAMGLSELKGKAKQKSPLRSLLTHKDCVYYRFLIEKEERRGRSSSWKTVSEGSSTDYFYIEDETGRLLVDPLDAEIILPLDYQYIDTIGKFLFTKRMRYTEWYIQPDEDIYVLGTVKKIKDDILSRKKKLRKQLRKLKEDKEKLKKLNIDKSSQISIEEWDKVEETIKQEIFGEELKQPPEPEDDIVIAKSDIEKIFIISDHSEKEITKKFGMKSVLLIFGGCCLIIGMLISLLARAGLLPEGLIIPWRKFYR